MMSTVDEVPRAADELDWGPVLAFLPWLAEAPQVGRMVAGEPHPEGGFTMPYETLSERAAALVQTLHDVGVVAPGIDWSRWLDGDGDVLRRDTDGSAIGVASLDDCRRVLVAYVRQARFVEGILLEQFRSGGILRILQRVQQLVGETG